jgi:hypothetical protein
MKKNIVCFTMIFYLYTGHEYIILSPSIVLSPSIPALSLLPSLMSDCFEARALSMESCRGGGVGRIRHHVENFDVLPVWQMFLIDCRKLPETPVPTLRVSFSTAWPGSIRTPCTTCACHAASAWKQMRG